MRDRLNLIAQHLLLQSERLKSWRFPLLVLGTSIFLVGGMYSLYSLNLDPADIQWTAVCALVALLAPLCVLYGGLNMMLTARAVSVRLGLMSAMRTSSVAQIAEFLPVPGGALVRGAALMRGGVSLGQSAAQIVANAVLWIALSAIAAGLSLLARTAAGGIVASVGMLLTLLTLAWIFRNAGASIAFLSLLLRSAGLLLAATRLMAAFQSLSLAGDLRDMFVFAFASIAGSAAAIAPGGLGISEGLAAALAPFTSSLPAAAFLAVALIRVLDLAFNGLFLLASGVIGLRCRGLKIGTGRDD